MGLRFAGWMRGSAGYRLADRRPRIYSRRFTGGGVSICIQRQGVKWGATAYLAPCHRRHVGGYLPAGRNNRLGKRWKRGFPSRLGVGEKSGGDRGVYCARQDSNLQPRGSKPRALSNCATGAQAALIDCGSRGQSGEHASAAVAVYSHAPHTGALQRAPPPFYPFFSNCASNTMRLEAKSAFLTNAAASAAPCSRSMF